MLSKANRMWSWLVNKINITPPSADLVFLTDRKGPSLDAIETTLKSRLQLVCARTMLQFWRFGARTLIKRELIASSRPLALGFRSVNAIVTKKLEVIDHHPRENFVRSFFRSHRSSCFMTAFGNESSETDETSPRRCKFMQITRNPLITMMPDCFTKLMWT